MIIGYLLATFIGLSLGLMGGGGSILTVPILVYILKMDPKLSIALSLAIVGATSLIGSYGHYKKGNIHLKVAIIFGPFAMLGTFIGAKLSVYFSAAIQLILFAIIMMIASIFMYKGRKESQQIEKSSYNIALIIFEGIVVGIVTGIVGVGGGFLIVPALVLIAGIPMKMAVGTSLLIISLKSITGFIGYYDQLTIPWPFLGTFIVFTGFGIIIGSKLVDHIPAKKLKKIFAIFLLIMGSAIIYKEVPKIQNKNVTLRKSVLKKLSHIEYRTEKTVHS